MTHRLFHYPLACSTACRLAAREFGIPLELVHADVFTKQTGEGDSLFGVNPMGQVATLQRFDGSVLTENTAILMWLQSRGPGLPAPESEAFFELLRWTSFCATELHKGLLWPLLRGDVSDSHKAFIRARAGARLDVLAARLEDRSFLCGAAASAADAYLVWVLVVAPFAGLDLTAWPGLVSYRDALLARPGWADVIESDSAAVRDDLARLGARDFVDAPTPAMAV